MPSGPWFCCKCRSQERGARVKCELCPNKGGALKRTESGGWAHVVCALYIPEVRFENVSTMEPINFSDVPNERFVKTCFICEEDGRENIRSVNGACMNCHKTGCKLSFHVTCAQSRRLLCEEGSVGGHVQYVGYCTSHWAKRFKQQPPSPPASPQLQTAEEKKAVPAKGKGRSRNDSTSSMNSVDAAPAKARGRKKNADISPDAKSENRNVSPEHGSGNKYTDITNPGKGKPGSQGGDDLATSRKMGSEKLKGSSPLNTPVPKNESKDEVTSNPKSLDKSKTESKKRKFGTEEEKAPKRQKVKTEKAEAKEKKKSKSSSIEMKKEKKFSGKDKTGSEKKPKFPVPSKLGLVENGKVSSWDSVTPKHAEPPDNFQDFLEHQWNQSAHFITSKAEHFDVASLLACLHQLKSDNSKLEKKLMNIQARRDRLLGVNARLAASFTDADEETCSNNRSPLSAMLSKLNDKSSTTTTPREKTPQAKSVKKKRPVASPDLAMLAAASVKLESESMTRIDENEEETNSESEVTADHERLTSLTKDSVNSLLVQPNITSRASSIMDSSLDRILAGSRHAYKNVAMFSDAGDNPGSSSSSSP